MVRKQTKKITKPVVNTPEEIIEKKTKVIPITPKQRAKQLSNQGYDTKEVADIMGIDKYEASRLIKG